MASYYHLALGKNNSNFWEAVIAVGQTLLSIPPLNIDTNGSPVSQMENSENA